MAALRWAALQPANQHVNRAKPGLFRRTTSEFPESCPGFEKRLKAAPQLAVVMRIAA